MGPMSVDDAKWQAESDARTLAEAKRIMADNSRLTAAQIAAKVMADKEEEEAKAMRKVADGGDPTRKPPQPGSGGSGPIQGGRSRIADSMAKVPLVMIKKK